MEKRTPLIDSHAHLAMLKHSPVKDILDRSEKAGISRILSISTDKESWQANSLLAGQFPFVFFSLGVHPHEASHWPEWEKGFLDLFPSLPEIPAKCVGIGETGLDFHYDFSPRELQIQAFEAQLNFAKKVNLPVVIHCREAFDTLFESIEKIGLGFRGGVMHCFTGGPEEAQKAVDYGLKISVSGILTFRNAEPIRKAAQKVRPQDLLIETDCPFLAPIPYRGKPNEPAFLTHTAQCLASTLGKSFEEIADVTTNNAIDFFQLS